jgi:hypothetical protein
MVAIKRHRGRDILDDEERCNAGDFRFVHVSSSARFPECSAIDTTDILYCVHVYGEARAQTRSTTDDVGHDDGLANGCNSAVLEVDSCGDVKQNLGPFRAGPRVS